MTKGNQKPKERRAPQNERENKGARKRGWDEIESLFDDKRKEKRRAEAESKDLQKKKAKNIQKVTKTAVLTKGDEWIDDGLGGKYNSEGFTGRIEDGVKVFKAHVLRKANAGQTDQCPFDCDCCYI